MKKSSTFIVIVGGCFVIAAVAWWRLRSDPTPVAAAPAIPAAVAESTAEAPWQHEARAAAARATSWLVDAQQPDGSWSDPRFPALSGLALWALIGADDDAAHAAVDRAVDFLLTCVRDDGGIYVAVPGRKGGGLSTYNTAICLTALHATGRRDLTRVLQNARTFLAAAQYQGEEESHFGGFGYDSQSQRDYTDLMNTHFAVAAMRRTQDVEDLRPADEAHADIHWEQVLRYVESLQAQPEDGTDNVGGFVYNPSDAKAGATTNAAGRVVLRAYGSITYAGLMALLYAEVPQNDPRVVSAVDFAARHWTLEENPGMGDQGLYFYYNVIARALTAGRMDVIARKEAVGETIHWREELARKLTAVQRPDGSWANSNNRFWENDPVLATAYALLALREAQASEM